MTDNNMQQKFETANIAYNGENFEEAYRLYSDILEKDFKNPKAWIGKGLAAGKMSSTDKNILQESKACFQKALEIGLPDQEKDEIIEAIFEISEEFIGKVHLSVSKRLTGMSARSMATYEKPSVREIGNLVDRIDAFSEHWEYYKKAFEYARYSLKINNSVENKKQILNLIKEVVNESKNHFDKNTKPELEKIRKQIIEEIKEEEPGFIEPTFEGDKGGCFIATVAYGSYNHPSVLMLREFRDNKLSKTKAGRMCINLYYQFGPKLAKAIGKFDLLKRTARNIIELTVVKMLRHKKL
jgi:tetratricopeptide (TPR) repeat protein